MSHTTSDRTRVNWVDAAKGLGILLVLLGHAPIPLAAKLYIYAFHMPLFFWLAGLFVKTDGPFLQFVQDKASRLLLPYFSCALVSYVIWLGIRGFSKMAAAIEPQTPLLGIFYGVGSGNWMPENPPLWFLPCLFVTLLLLYGLARLSRKWLGGLLAGSSVLGYELMQHLAVRLPWSLDVAFSAVVFAGLGMLFRRGWLPWMQRTAPAWPLLLASAAIWLGCAWLNAQSIGMVDMNNGVFGNYFLFYASALAGIMTTAGLARRLQSLPLVGAIGQASLTIFCLHMLVYLFVTAIGKKLLHLNLAITYERLMSLHPHPAPVLTVLLYVVPGLLVPWVLVLTAGRLKLWLLSNNIQAFKGFEIQLSES